MYIFFGNELQFGASFLNKATYSVLFLKNVSIEKFFYSNLAFLPYEQTFINFAASIHSRRVINSSS